MLSRSDLASAGAIGLAMAVGFAVASHGTSLVVTFVPGVAIALSLTIWLWHRKRPLPAGRDVWPWYLIALAVQFVHFAEENSTGFASKFPMLYDGTPYASNTFVSFNMASYAIFTLSSIALWVVGSKKLVMPLLFFCVYGALGNAVAHALWAIRAGGYFPGLYTSLPYWILGPLLVHRFMGRWLRETLTYVCVTIASLVPVLWAFAN